MDYIAVKKITKRFSTTSSFSSKNHLVLDEVSFSVQQGETLAVVGESGSGKTTLGRCLLRLIDCDHGKVIYKKRDILGLSERQFRELRPKFQMIFQDPEQSLNPRQTVYSCLKEVVNKRKSNSAHEVFQKIKALLDSVQLSTALLNHYPRNLSGGQRQRLSIARALAMNPEFIVADEPTSSLDATLKWHIMGLLLRLKEIHNLTILLISHDLPLVTQVADRIIVMKDGRIVEVANTKDLISLPLHPYTNILLGASLQNQDMNSFEVTDNGGQHFDKSGCAYYMNCNKRGDICRNVKPDLETVIENHEVACHHTLKNNQFPAVNEIFSFNRSYISS